jgi:hypothetical protein
LRTAEDDICSTAFAANAFDGGMMPTFSWRGRAAWIVAAIFAAYRADHRFGDE